MDDLVETARRANGSALLPKVSFGVMNTEVLMLRMADSIEQLVATCETLDAENARLREVAQIVQKLPPGKWEPWSSCSFRRITAEGGPDGGVLHATVHASDGHPDLSWDEETCRALCDLVNGLRAALKENTDDKQ